jgi:hypothetical protein
MPCLDPRDEVVGPAARYSTAEYDEVCRQRNALQGKLDMIKSECEFRQQHNHNTEATLLASYILWLAERR